LLNQAYNETWYQLDIDNMRLWISFATVVVGCGSYDKCVLNAVGRAKQFIAFKIKENPLVIDRISAACGREYTVTSARKGTNRFAADQAVATNYQKAATVAH
jgi:hypothetical protein